MASLYDPAYVVNHRCDDGMVIPMNVQRVGYSPMHQWEAYPVGPRTYQFKAWARTRRDAIAQSVDNYRNAQGADGTVA